ncbi:uncharacterized protein GGS22DRAFT_155536 [Annulohypoxylon maeteangense]|uniref:uncharacterized protein n=1 Tax=Annulohypoxylon maeteangense TaxID=1927788 RepID=UPI00200764C9|nr:uncharacterized protein GGS22DRAFT_155536 [Annulohypoxylon maeteangense]KAI0888301.1 hypothetical protein GGS22DRAFT_155536 [Annulohypoxylon maeteangense]
MRMHRYTIGHLNIFFCSLVTTITGSSRRVSPGVNGIDFSNKCNHLNLPSSVIPILILISVPMAWHLFSVREPSRRLCDIRSVNQPCPKCRYGY